jgi:hypothetical protein
MGRTDRGEKGCQDNGERAQNAEIAATIGLYTANSFSEGFDLPTVP